MTNSSAVADLVTLASGVVFDPKKEVLVMGAPVKRSTLTPERKEAMKVQVAFDRAAHTMGPTFTALNLYGGMDVPEYNENCSYAVALALDAERTHSRFVFHVESLSRLAGYEDAQVAAWGVKFAADPAYAFECASNVAEAAAKARVFRTLAVMTLECGPFKTFAYAQEQALRGARWPSHSTSPMANLMHEADTAAWAEFVADRMSHFR